jgi:hypothetical protein
MIRGGLLDAVSSIDGGFVSIPVASLMAAWRACRSDPLGTGDFRAWLAAREMVARRCTLEDGRSPAYSATELGELCGTSERRARASIRRLGAAGLLEFSPSAIEFPVPADFDPALDGLDDSIGRGRGQLAIPRRVLRYLADGAGPALIATALGVLLRCLSRRRSGFGTRGRFKASWISENFGVDVRQVKAARARLVALGWITPEPGDQWAMNRWGRAYRVDLGWASPSSADGASSPPPRPVAGASPPPPDLHQEPLRGEKHQEPASRRPAGVQAPGFGSEKTPPHPESGSLPPPRLADVRLEDLKDTGRLLELHRQAVDQGVVTPSDSDRLNFVAAAERAVEVGKSNPPGLFAYLVRGGLWRYLNQGDEDRANARLKAHRRATEPPGEPCRIVAPPASSPGSPGGPSDAEVVKAVRAAAIRAGVFKDPFPEFARRWGWSRERYDAALAAM